MRTIEVAKDPHAAHRGAHKRTVQESIPEIVAFLAEVLGRRLTAHLAGVADVHQVANWISAKNAPRPESEKRLRAAYQVFQLLQASESPHVVRAWFIGMNPQLDDVSPVEAIAEDRLKEVMAAARAFATGG